jgi:molecular chaperone DnaK
VGRLIGIDLGTTSSCVAVMEGGAPQIIPNQEGARTTPSVVAFTARGEPLVGRSAELQALTNPQNTVFAVKRLIGRKFNSDEVTRAREFFPYTLVESPNGDVHVRVENRVYSTPEISSFVLQKLKAAAEDYLGEPVEEAIITVPAYFNDPQRQATKDAGLIAGLKVSRIINEPTAAALAYGLKNAKGQFVAVYDLGGGTFDISILEMADGLFQVKATGGNTFLGGWDFDLRIMDWLITEFHREVGIDLKQDVMALQRLREAAEKAKCELSTALEAAIMLPFIATDASGPKHLNTVLTRQKYESLTNDLLEQTEKPCRSCLADAQMRADQIDEVLLVGGQSRAPKVAETVFKVFGKEPKRVLNPDESVALGAAILTGIIAGEVKDLVLLDVTPHTLGIETKDGTFTSLIDRNSTIPTRKSRVFTTVADNQTRVEVHVLQGESTVAAYNKSLAKFELTSIPPAPKGKPQIEVTFEIDVNGIVSVGAEDQATRRSQSMVIHPSSGLSQAEVNQLALERRPARPTMPVLDVEIELGERSDATRMRLVQAIRKTRLVSTGSRAESVVWPAILEALPILPLRDVVLFPGVFLPLAVARESSVALVRRASRRQQPIGVVMQREADIDSPVQSDLCGVGALAHVRKIVFEAPDGSLRLVAEGLRRVRVLEVTQYRPFLAATVEVLDDNWEAEQESEIRALAKETLHHLERYVESTPMLSEGLLSESDRLKNPDFQDFFIESVRYPAHLADYIAGELLPLSAAQKQELLEEPDVLARLERINRLIDSVG